MTRIVARCMSLCVLSLLCAALAAPSLALAQATAAPGRAAVGDDVAQAQAELEKARRDAAALPRHAGRQSGLAHAHHRLADVLAERARPGDEAAAARHYEAAIAIRKRLVAADRNDWVAEYETAGAHAGLAGLKFKNGADAAAARHHLQLAVGSMRRVVTQLPQDHPAQADLPDLLVDLAVTYPFEEAAEPARAALAESTAIWQRLVAARPDDESWRGKLARSHDTLGWLLAARRRAPESAEQHQAALALRQQLLARKPQDTALLTEIGDRIVVSRGLGPQQAAFDPPAAMRSYAVAVDALERATRIESTPERESLALQALDALAKLQRKHGDARAAVATAKRTVARGEALAAAAPDSLTLRMVVADTYLELAGYQRHAGDPAGAMASCRAVFGALEPVAAQAGQNRDLRGRLLLAHMEIGEALKNQGDRAGAADELRRGLAMLERSADDSDRDLLRFGDLYWELAEVTDPGRERTRLLEQGRDKMRELERRRGGKLSPGDRQWLEQFERALAR